MDMRANDFPPAVECQFCNAFVIGVGVMRDAEKANSDLPIKPEAGQPLATAILFAHEHCLAASAAVHCYL